MPAFPLLAAVPAGSHGSGPGWLAVLVLACPYLAGAAGGVLVVRIAPTTVLESAAIRGFCCGLLTGIVLGVGAAFAGGPLGDGRLAVVGPSPWQVAAGAALQVRNSGAVTSRAVNRRGLRRQPARRPAAPTVPLTRPPADPGRPPSACR